MAEQQTVSQEQQWSAPTSSAPQALPQGAQLSNGASANGAGMPFPTLLASSASPPQAAGQAWGSPAPPFPAMLPPTLANAPQSTVALANSPQSMHPSSFAPPAGLPASVPAPAQPLPRLGAHVQVPASMLSVNDDDGPPPLEPVQPVQHSPSAAGHSHDGVACGHAHGNSNAPPRASNGSPTAHGHSHASTLAHAHSHGGGDDHGHSHSGGDHGHSHGPAPTFKVVPQWEESSSATSGPWRRRIVRMMGAAWYGGGDGRSLLVYIMSKVGMVVLQLWWGLVAQNLGMVSSSFHTAFDVLALACALVALLNAKYPARAPFTYGLDRQQVVSAFTNAVFLIFVATFMIVETVHTVYAPPELERSDVVVALVGLGCDAMGLLLFARYMRGRTTDEFSLAAANAAATSSAAGIWTHGGAGAPLLGSGSTGGAGLGATPLLLSANAARGHYENMHGVSLHVLADLVGHGSLLSAVWIHASFPSFTLVFALSFLLSALLIIRMVLPLFRATGAVLLMTTPAHLRLALDRAMREVSFYDGVLELRAAHWWTHAPGVVVGSMHVRIRADAQEQAILAYVHSVLRKYCALLTVQIEKDQMPAHWNTHVLQA